MGRVQLMCLTAGNQCTCLACDLGGRRCRAREVDAECPVVYALPAVAVAAVRARARAVRCARQSVAVFAAVWRPMLSLPRVCACRAIACCRTCQSTRARYLPHSRMPNSCSGTRTHTPCRAARRRAAGRTSGQVAGPSAATSLLPRMNARTGAAAGSRSGRRSRVNCGASMQACDAARRSRRSAKDVTRSVRAPSLRPIVRAPARMHCECVMSLAMSDPLHVRIV